MQPGGFQHPGGRHLIAPFERGDAHGLGRFGLRGIRFGLLRFGLIWFRQFRFRRFRLRQFRLRLLGPWLLGLWCHWNGYPDVDE